MRFEAAGFADSIRLILAGNHTLTALAAIEPAFGDPHPQTLPIDLEHSRHEATAGPFGVVLQAGDQFTATLRDTFECGPHRVFAIISAPSVAAGSAQSRPVDPAPRPALFALQQNEPNPFGEGTVIRFALPAQSAVALEIFDVNGRRVHTLTRREWEPGYHTLVWDGRNTAGRRMKPGIYLYRMTAGSYRAHRKLAVLP